MENNCIKCIKLFFVNNNLDIFFKYKDIDIYLYINNKIINNIEFIWKKGKNNYNLFIIDYLNKQIKIYPVLEKLNKKLSENISELFNLADFEIIIK